MTTNNELTARHLVEHREPLAAVAAAVRKAQHHGLTITAIKAYLDLIDSGVLAEPDTTTTTQQRRRMTRKLLREVAEVYRRALAEGEAPTKAVANRYGVPHRTAARWVGQARKAGELGPAVGPTGGEEVSGDRP